MDGTPERATGNPTITVEMTEDGKTIIGVFRDGRIGLGGSLDRVTNPDTGLNGWHGQTALRNDLGLDPVYKGSSEAIGLLTTLQELDHEIRKGWTGKPEVVSPDAERNPPRREFP